MISIIAAYDDDRGIGKDGKLPWRSRYDMAMFKEITMGRAVVMGRKTIDSLPKKQPLKGRANIVITRDIATAIRNYEPYRIPIETPQTSIGFASTLADGVQVGRAFGPEVVIIGGAEVYAQALPVAERLYLSHIEGRYGCDTFLPEIDLSGPTWMVARIQTGGGEDGQPKVIFTEYRRQERR